MKTLNQILRTYYVPFVPADVLGSVSVSEEEIDIPNLSKQLDTLKKELNKKSLIALSMILLLFFISLFFCYFYLKNPTHIASIFSALGFSTGWTVIQMNKWWKQIARINLIIILCTSLQPAQVNDIVKTLIEKNDFLK